MPRIDLPTLDTLTPEQRVVYAQTMAGRRGTVPANVRLWLHRPELASRAQRLGEWIRYETSLGRRASELAILVVARHWTAQYEWAVHEEEARRAGVPADVVRAIAERQAPPLEGDDRAVYDLTSALVATGRVPDDVFTAAIATLGRPAVVELVALAGYYTMVAFSLNAFEIPPPAGGAVLGEP